MNEPTLDELVIQLHNIARRIEADIGTGLLSDDVRNCADRLSNLLKKELASEH